jgi:hypothetical protein
MNIIENGKQKHVDFDFMLAICQKCHVSADYILGLRNDYRNHENEFVCNYTGLEEHAVSILHEWEEDKNNGTDISKIDEVFVGEDAEEEIRKTYKKKQAIQFLRILNLLFMDDLKAKKKTARYSNLRILYSLYTLCIEKPSTIYGKVKFTEEQRDYISYFNPSIENTFDKVYLDATDVLMLKDESYVWYPFDAKQIIEQVARDHLNKAVDDLIDRVKKENANSINPAGIAEEW